MEQNPKTVKRYAIKDLSSNKIKKIIGDFFLKSC